MCFADLCTGTSWHLDHFGHFIRHVSARPAASRMANERFPPLPEWPSNGLLPEHSLPDRSFCHLSCAIGMLLFQHVQLFMQNLLLNLCPCEIEEWNLTALTSKIHYYCCGQAMKTAWMASTNFDLSDLSVISSVSCFVKRASNNRHQHGDGRARQYLKPYQIQAYFNLATALCHKARQEQPAQLQIDSPATETMLINSIIHIAKLCQAWCNCQRHISLASQMFDPLQWIWTYTSSRSSNFKWSGRKLRLFDSPAKQVHNLAHFGTKEYNLSM